MRNKANRSEMLKCLSEIVAESGHYETAGIQWAREIVKAEQSRLKQYRGYRRFRAHDKECAESFREDREHGLIYGPFLDSNGSPYLTWEDASYYENFCAYCGPNSE